jgi:hypothetical protein
MFTLDQIFFIVQCYFRNGERLEKDLRTANGPIRHLEFLTNFKKSFCTKKAVDDQQKDLLKLLKRLNKELQRPQ